MSGYCQVRRLKTDLTIMFRVFDNRIDNEHNICDIRNLNTSDHFRDLGQVNFNYQFLIFIY